MEEEPEAVDAMAAKAEFLLAVGWAANPQVVAAAAVELDLKAMGQVEAVAVEAE